MRSIIIKSCYVILYNSGQESPRIHRRVWRCPHALQGHGCAHGAARSEAQEAQPKIHHVLQGESPDLPIPLWQVQSFARSVIFFTNCPFKSGKECWCCTVLNGYCDFTLWQKLDIVTIFPIPNSKCQFYYCKTITLWLCLIGYCDYLFQYEERNNIS